MLDFQTARSEIAPTVIASISNSTTLGIVFVFFLDELPSVAPTDIVSISRLVYASHEQGYNRRKG